MSKRKFTTKQIQELMNNEYVNKCSEKSITYSADFKVMAVRRYEEEGLNASQIFKEAGFDLQVIGRHVPDDRLASWRKIQRTRGIECLSDQARGGHRRKVMTKNPGDVDRIERLEATVAYLKAENDFLAKIRGKQRE